MGLLKMIDRFIYNFFSKLDYISELIGKLFAPRCKCKNKRKKK